MGIATTLNAVNMKKPIHTDVAPPPTIKTKKQFLERLQRSHEQFLRGEYQDADIVVAELQQKYGL